MDPTSAQATTRSVQRESIITQDEIDARFNEIVRREDEIAARAAIESDIYKLQSLTDEQIEAEANHPENNAHSPETTAAIGDVASSAIFHEPTAEEREIGAEVSEYQNKENAQLIEEIAAWMAAIRARELAKPVDTSSRRSDHALAA